MAKNILFIFSLCFSVIVFGQVHPTLTEIPADVFVNNGKTDFDKIIYQDNSLEDFVKELHAHNELSHDFPVYSNNFSTYWQVYQSQWFFISFQENASPLLLFKGFKNANDEREYVEIYDMTQKTEYRLLFSEVGVPLAYKTHPFTQELILYVHKYPCCRSASHNLYKIRQIDKQLIVFDRFFVGRDRGDMVGPFFPENATFDKNYHQLKEKTALRWSPAVLNESAYINWSESNLIIHYDAGATYKILGQKDDWLFVLMLSGITEEQSLMLNAVNFKNKGVYGWINKNL